MRRNPSDEIKRTLLRNKNLAMILYILSQIPSYTQELAAELKLPKSTVRESLNYLIKKRLIRVLYLNSTRNSTTGDLYPLLLKKIKKIRSCTPPDKIRSTLKSLKFYFISRRGISFLQFIQNFKEMLN